VTLPAISPKYKGGKMAIKNEFSEYLTFYKQNHNLTAKQLAKILGIPKRTVDSWLDGFRNPNEFTQNAVKEKLKKEEAK